MALTLEYAKLVNQKLSFARLMLDELQSLLSAQTPIDEGGKVEKPVTLNRRLIQATFESILHHLSTALLGYLFEIDAFAGRLPSDKVVGNTSGNSVIDCIDFKELLSIDTNNPNVEELKILYQKPQSAIRFICDFKESVSRHIQAYVLPGEGVNDSDSNLIAVEKTEESLYRIVSVEQLTNIFHELDDLFTRQRSMSVEE